MGLTSTSSYSLSSDRCTDGYVRLTLASFMALRFDHRIAWIDEDLREELALAHIPACRAGYCEWASRERAPLISLGWAWFRLSGQNQTFLAPGGISSNVMLVTSRHYDLGARETDALLRQWLADQPWAPPDNVSGYENVECY